MADAKNDTKESSQESVIRKIRQVRKYIEATESRHEFVIRRIRELRKFIEMAQKEIELPWLAEYKAARIRSIFSSLNARAYIIADRPTYRKIELDLAKLSEHCSKWRNQLFDAQARAMAATGVTDPKATDAGITCLLVVANEINSVAVALDDVQIKLTSDSSSCLIC
jgi:peptidoglycan hydrolase CwlO-like protein